MIVPRTLVLGPALAAALLGAMVNHGKSFADSIVVTPSKDNSLIPTEDGSLSFGLTPFVFAGRVGNHAGGGTVRRGLVHFEIADLIPARSTIESVVLDVFCTQTNTKDMQVSLHRALKDWGEGESNPPGGGGAPATRGDATWLHSFWPDQYWTNPGGDFQPVASGTTTIALAGPYQWSSQRGMVADVQLWIDSPELNFGWVIIGNEEILQAVKALASKDTDIGPEYMPHLTITYSPPSPLEGDFDMNGIVDGADLGQLLGAWGDCPPRRACMCDINADGAVDGADLGILLGNWS